MGQMTRPRLLLIELLGGFLFFCICSASSMLVFSKAASMNAESELLVRAVEKAQMVAESYKVANGDMQRTKEILGEMGMVLELEQDGLVCIEKSEDDLIVRLMPEKDRLCHVADVKVCKSKDDQVVYRLRVAT